MANKFLEACVRDIFEITVNGAEDPREIIELTDIVFSTQIKIANRRKHIGNFVSSHELGREKILSTSVAKIMDYLVNNCTELKFDSALQNNLRGSRVKIYDYHEPESYPSLVEILAHDYRGPLVNAIVWGSIPAVATTVLATTPSIAQNLALNILHQGISWGLSGGIATAVGIYYSVKEYRNPKKEYEYDRELLGREIITRDEIVLEHPEEIGLPNGAYTGKRVSYHTLPPEERQSIDITGWAAANQDKSLYQVKLKDNISRYAVHVFSMEIITRNERIVLGNSRSFLSESIKIDVKDLNPNLPSGYFTTAYQVTPLGNKPRFKLESF